MKSRLSAVTLTLGVMLLASMTLVTGRVGGVSTATAAPASSAPSVVRPVVPTLRWKPCGGGGKVECATAKVPMDYDRPRGDSTTIAMLRLPAAKPAKRLGSLFVNPGGPGGSGVDFVRTSGATTLSQTVRDHYDVIGFDPRFVGASDPAMCYDSPEEEAIALARLTPFPLTAAEAPNHINLRSEVTEQCKANAGERMEHGSSANVARDLDLLRRAVGDNKLNYLGYSYGSFLGATYGMLFPQKVGRLVADGAVDPVEYSGRNGDRRAGGARIGQGPAAAQAFEQFFKACREAAERCALNTLGDPKTVVSATLESLKQTPVTIELGAGPTEVNYPYAIALAFDAMYSPAAWTPLADTFVKLAQGGVPSRLRAEPARREPEPYPSMGGALASACVDAPVRIKPREFQRLADAEDLKTPYFGRYRAWNGLECSTTRLVDRDAYRGGWQQTTKQRVLVIGTRYDPATPYDDTRKYAKRFPRARILTVEGFGHTTVEMSTCAQQAMTAYLVRGELPRAGATCGQDVSPFAAITTRPTAPLRRHDAGR